MIILVVAAAITLWVAAAVGLALGLGRAVRIRDRRG